MPTIRSISGLRRAGLLVAFLAPTLLPSSSAAQEAPVGMELRPFVGAYVPTGGHAGLLRTGALIGFQGALGVSRHISVVGTAAWLPNEDKTTSADGAVDLYQYDLGAEVGASKMLANGAVLGPFVGLGVGGRSLGYRDREPRPQHDIAAYAALGGQLRIGRVGVRRVDLRIETRGYVTAFKGLTGELAKSQTRNDVTIATGLAVGL